MKKIILFILSFALLATLISCGMSESDTSGSSEGIATEETEAPAETEYEFRIDEERSHMPTYEETKKIKKEMTLGEIIDILGNPHYANDKLPLLNMKWYTSDGYYCDIDFLTPSGVSSHLSNIDKIMTLGKASSIIRSIKTSDEVVNTYEKLTEIKLGMTKDEVYALVGGPQHRESRLLPYNPTSSLGSKQSCDIYDSLDGLSVFVIYGSETQGVVYVLSESPDYGVLTDNSPDRVLPSLEELLVIKKDMTRPEVYAIAGKPQRIENRRFPMDGFSGLAAVMTCEVYDTSDGECVFIIYGFYGHGEVEIVSQIETGPKTVGK